MTIGDFLEYAMDTEYVEIWDCETGETAWKGWSDEIPEMYEEQEINTWNSIKHGICFNVGIRI